MLIRRPLGLHFGFAATLHLLSQSTLDLMHRAGFDFVFVGVESGSARVLTSLNKPARPDALAAGIQRAKKAHIVVVASFIAGAPNETESDFQATLDFVRNVRPHFCDINPLMVHPGSRLWEDFNREPPITLDSSSNKTVWRFSDGVDKGLTEKRIAQFRKVFSDTVWGRWGLDPRRIVELIGMIIHNKSVRVAAGILMKDIRSAASLGKGVKR